LSALRIATRVAAFGMALLAWGMIRLTRPRVAATHPAALWLTVTTAWLALEILNPGTNTLVAGGAQAALYIAVFSPVFWVPAARRPPQQLGRIMAILMVCNGLSALVGIGQVYRPGTFNPPVIPALQDDPEGFRREMYSYKTDDGRE